MGTGAACHAAAASCLFPPSVGLTAAFMGLAKARLANGWVVTLWFESQGAGCSPDDLGSSGVSPELMLAKLGGCGSVIDLKGPFPPWRACSWKCPFRSPPVAFSLQETRESLK